MRKWTRWQGLTVVAVGAVAALSTVWSTHSTAPLWMIVALGVLVAASGVVDPATQGRQAFATCRRASDPPFRSPNSVGRIQGGHDGTVGARITHP